MVSLLVFLTAIVGLLAASLVVGTHILKQYAELDIEDSINARGAGKIFALFNGVALFMDLAVISVAPDDVVAVFTVFFVSLLTAIIGVAWWVGFPQVLKECKRQAADTSEEST